MLLERGIDDVSESAINRINYLVGELTKMIDVVDQNDLG